MITACAVVNLETNIVDNCIMVDPDLYPAPDGYLFVANPPGFVQPGIEWDGENFIDPGAPLPQAKPQIDGLDTV
jgi:hypothetical protein